MIANIIAAIFVVIVSFFLWKFILNKPEKDKNKKREQSESSSSDTHESDADEIAEDKAEDAEIIGKRIPGMEPSDPKLGNIQDMKEAGSFHQFLIKLHKQYGDIASFYMGETYAVSFGSAKYFKGSIKLFDRPEIFFILLEPLIRLKCVQYANYEDGRKRRQLYDRSLSHENIEPLYAIFNKCANEIVTWWSSFPAGDEIAINDDVISLAIRIICSSAFGDFLRDPSKVQEVQEGYYACWGYFEKLVMGELNAEDMDETFNNSKQALHDIIDNLIEYRKKFPNENEYLLIDSMLDSDLPDDVIAADVLVYMIGGFHTSGNLIIWSIYYLSHNETVQQKVYEEIKANLDDDEEITAQNSIKLKFLMQVIDEAMRCSILAPYSARFSPEDIVVNGYTIPKETPIVNALGVTLCDEKVFPEPTKFDPERFSDKQQKTRQPLAFEPFGMGKRKCPGYRFAYAEVLTVLTVVLRKFKIIGVEQPNLKHLYSLVTRTSEDVLIKLEPR